MFGGKDGANPFGGGFMEKVKEAQVHGGLVGAPVGAAAPLRDPA